MRKAWMNSIITRFMVGFAIVILATLAAFLFVYQQAHEFASRLTYEKLYSQAEYYMQSFDTQLEHVKLLQNDFFNDRKLVFIIGQDMNISDYERRDCLLSVQERINSIVGVSNLVSSGVSICPSPDIKSFPTPCIAWMRRTRRK